MFEKIKTLIAALRVRAARKKADHLAKAFGCKYFVILLNGKLKVVPKGTLKKLIAKGRFKRGVTIHDIEKRAIYITR